MNEQALNQDAMEDIAEDVMEQMFAAFVASTAARTVSSFSEEDLSELEAIKVLMCSEAHRNTILVSLKETLKAIPDAEAQQKLDEIRVEHAKMEEQMRFAQEQFAAAQEGAE